WNEYHDRVVDAARGAGADVFDYRAGDEAGPEAIFGPDFQNLTAADFAAALASSIAQEKLRADQDAIDRCDVFILLLPAGKSSHLESGYALRAGKRTIIAALDGVVPAELIYALADHIVTSIPELLSAVIAGDGGFGDIALRAIAEM